MDEPMSRQEFTNIVKDAIAPLSDKMTELKADFSGVKSDISSMKEDMNHTKNQSEIANLKITILEKEQSRLEIRLKEDREKSEKQDKKIEIDLTAVGNIARSTEGKIKIYGSILLALGGIVIGAIELIKYLKG